MTSRERVLAALRREIPDRVPWMEGIVDDALASELCGEQISVNWDIAPDGTPVASGAYLAEQQKKVCRALGKDNLNYNAFAPVYAGKTSMEGVVIVGEGLIHTRDDLKLIQFPDMDAPEPDEPGGLEAKAALVAAIEGKAVFVTFSRRKKDRMPARDRYGRLLAKISSERPIADIRKP